MSRLDQLKLDITEMTDEELRERVREIRGSRKKPSKRSIYGRSGTRKDPMAAIREALAGLSPEEKAELLGKK